MVVMAGMYSLITIEINLQGMKVYGTNAVTASIPTHGLCSISVHLVDGMVDS